MVPKNPAQVNLANMHNKIKEGLKNFKEKNTSERYLWTPQFKVGGPKDELKND